MTTIEMRRTPTGEYEPVIDEMTLPELAALPAEERARAFEARGWRLIDSGKRRLVALIGRLSHAEAF